MHIEREALSLIGKWVKAKRRSQKVMKTYVREVSIETQKGQQYRRQRISEERRLERSMNEAQAASEALMRFWDLHRA